MTTAERIKRIANKAKAPYNAIEIIVYGVYGNSVTTRDRFEERLKILEKQYGIQ